MTHLISDIR